MKAKLTQTTLQLHAVLKHLSRALDIRAQESKSPIGPKLRLVFEANILGRGMEPEGRTQEISYIDYIH